MLKRENHSNFSRALLAVCTCSVLITGCGEDIEGGENESGDNEGGEVIEKSGADEPVDLGNHGKAIDSAGLKPIGGLGLESEQEPTVRVGLEAVTGPVWAASEADADGAVEFQLPEAGVEMLTAEAGRYLIIHFKESRQIGVFDVRNRKVVGHIPVKVEGISYAASQGKLPCMAGSKNLVIQCTSCISKGRLWSTLATR